jgi:transposase
MKRRGSTRTLLWQDHNAEQPQGYAYSWFCERHRHWKKSVSPMMRQSHAAGEKLFVD